MRRLPKRQTWHFRARVLQVAHMIENSMSVIILLLVEDDETLQNLLEIALSDEGFEVVLASNGTKAIAELNADGARFKGLVTDIQLGAGPNGLDVGRRAREVVSGLPVVYMSGDSAHDMVSARFGSSVWLT